MIEIRLTHRLPGLTLDVDLAAPGGVTSLFGHSGAGKTSVINAVAGLLVADRARIVVAGRVLTDDTVQVPVHLRRVGYVFQEGRLFPHLSVRANLRYGARRRDLAQEARVVEMLGLGALLQRRPGTLSGGEARRVAIGRALLSQPEILLLDEPLTGLDAARRAEILPYLERLRDETGIPMLHVSHDVSEVARLATTVAVLEGGRITRQGPVAEILSDPAAIHSLGPREAGALLTGHVAAHHADGLTEITVSGGTLLLPRVASEVGEPIRVRIAARDVILATERPRGLSALNILECTVTELRPGEGPGMAVQMRAGVDLILARITRRSAQALALTPGGTCYAVIKSVSVAKADVGARSMANLPAPSRA